MSNYPGLKLGNVLPAVGILQRLLVRAGHHVRIDGEFGSGTKEALQNFQRSFGMTATGKTDPLTWERLVAGEYLPILDVVDVFDPSLFNLEARDLRRVGGSTILLGGMCNGVEQAIDLIIAQAPPELFMLRFHGHGASGGAAISAGDWSATGGYEHDVIRTWGSSYWASLLRQLRGVFGPYGCIQFMHCETGRGTQGQQLMGMVADATGVPASSAIDTQYGGGTSTFFFEGPTRSRVPNGSSIRSWSGSRPSFRTAPSSSV